MAYLWIAIGGAIGASARYLVGGIVHRFAPPFFPWGTFTVNLVGCLVFGVVAGLAEHRFVVGPVGRAFVMIGILGGFTTFSSFTFETFELLRDGQVGRAAFNVAGQVVLGLVGLWAGFVLTRA